MTYGASIQNALVSRAMAFDFPVYRHSVAVAGGQRTPAAPPTTVRPQTAIAHQEARVFSEPQRLRRTGPRREVETSSWLLVLQFGAAVSTDEFEDTLMVDVPRIARDVAGGRPLQVELLLEDAEYQTPVTQQPAQGTRVTYRFTAQFSPS